MAVSGTWHHSVVQINCGLTGNGLGRYNSLRGCHVRQQQFAGNVAYGEYSV